MSGSGTSRPGLYQELPQLLFGEIVSKIVYAAAELEIADLLAEGPQTSAELARCTGTHAASLRRLLRALAGIGLLAESDPDRFELTELGGPLRADAPDSIRALLLMRCGPEFWQSWGALLESLRSGEPGWMLVHGMSWVDYYERNPGPAATFNRAMAEHTREAAPAMVAAAGLERFATVMDIGGGDGTLIAEALRAHPRLEGAVFDLPVGLEAAPATLAAAGVAERCRLVPGDFFEGIPGGVDAYLLKQVIHDWDDEAAVAILHSLRDAVSPGSRVLILERVIGEPATRADLQSLLVDVLMLVVTGGRERTEQEFRTLLEAAGFEPVSVSDAIPPFGYRVIDAMPAGTTTKEA